MTSKHSTFFSKVKTSFNKNILRTKTTQTDIQVAGEQKCFVDANTTAANYTEHKTKAFQTPSKVWFIPEPTIIPILGGPQHQGVGRGSRSKTTGKHRKGRFGNSKKNNPNAVSSVDTYKKTKASRKLKLKIKNLSSCLRKVLGLANTKVKNKCHEQGTKHSPSNSADFYSSIVVDGTTMAPESPHSVAIESTGSIAVESTDFVSVESTGSVAITFSSSLSARPFASNLGKPIDSPDINSIGYTDPPVKNPTFKQWCGQPSDHIKETAHLVGTRIKNRYKILKMDLGLTVPVKEYVSPFDNIGGYGSSNFFGNQTSFSGCYTSTSQYNDCLGCGAGFQWNGPSPFNTYSFPNITYQELTIPEIFTRLGNKILEWAKKKKWRIGIKYKRFLDKIEEAKLC